LSAEPAQDAAFLARKQNWKVAGYFHAHLAASPHLGLENGGTEGAGWESCSSKLPFILFIGGYLALGDESSSALGLDFALFALF
jgi:hypothetical protein